MVVCARTVNPILALFNFLPSFSSSLTLHLTHVNPLTRTRHHDSMLSVGEQAGFEVSPTSSLDVSFTDQSQATIVRPDGTKFSVTINFYLWDNTHRTQMSMESNTARAGRE